ncbi:flagellar hook protein FlgE [Hansschlegelia sp. KR7-227]|uniref:flagellar hook protein FlgE n=1 Tax=Hansschlegelia sp. KR7-227 TaxID=3400914 RepID=UPI003BFBA866
MGIYGALNTAVSGIQAQSFALENISGNIANSQTAAYKRTDTSFADLVLGGDMNVRRQVAGSVQGFSRATNDVQGTVQASSSATALAIKGQGFLIVQDQTGEVDGRPTFGGDDLYTRRGDFEVDKNGYLVNGSGYFLKGVRVDAATGNPVGSVPELVKFDNDFYPASATTSVDYRANLPVVPQTTNYDSSDASSWLLGSGFGATVPASQSDDFIASTISGDAVTVYDEKGGSHDVQFRWGKVSNESATATPATDDVWSLYYLSDGAATGADAAWTRVDADPSAAGDQNYAFDSDGNLKAPADGLATITNLTVNGVNLGDIALNHGQGLTQYADSEGQMTTKALDQDGAPSGKLVNFEIADGGLIQATYSNGKSRPLYKVPLVTFNAENRLAHLDGGAYAQTVGSGLAIEGTEGEIVGQALEQSNVDIADEFTKMIVTQQAYSANTRVVTTSDSMMQEALSMIR